MIKHAVVEKTCEPNEFSGKRYQYISDRLPEPYLKPLKEHSKNLHSFLYVENSATILGKIGIVVNKDGKLLLEPALNKPYYVIKTGDAKYYFFRRLLPKRRLKGRALLLSGSVSDNYFMWVHFYLPLLRWIREEGLDESHDFKVILSGNFRKFQQSSLNMLGYNENIFLHKGLRLEVEELLIPSFDYLDIPTSSIGLFNIMSTKSVRWLNRVYTKAVSNTSSQNTRILISRSKTQSRRIINEEELMDQLEYYGFKQYWLEDLTFKQQVELFNLAEIVVAPHGAGLTNIVFGNDMKVFEFYPSNRGFNNPKNLQVCMILNHEYHLMAIDTDDQFQNMVLEEEHIGYILHEMEKLV